MSSSELDEVDLKILEHLVTDARLSQRALARSIGMSPPAISERISRLEAAGDFGGDVELVRNELDAPAHKSPHRRAPPLVLMLQGRQPQVENFRGIMLPREQPVLRLVEADRVAQERLAQLTLVVAVVQEPRPLGDGQDHQRSAIMALDRVADAEAHAAQGSIVAGVLPGLPARGEDDRDSLGAQPQHRAQPEFGLTVTDPALAGMETDLHEGYETERSGSARGAKANGKRQKEKGKRHRQLSWASAHASAP